MVLNDSLNSPPTTPKTLVDAEEIRAREADLGVPRMAALTELVKRIRQERDCGNSVPWFDPQSGGVHAQALLLSEAPGGKAVGPGTLRASQKGSGFISPDNNDGTAANVFRLEAETGLNRSKLLHWNIVPWYVGSTTRIRRVSSKDLLEAAPWLAELLKLLLDLQVVVLCGKRAQAGWYAHTSEGRDNLKVLRCPHPSPVNLNTRPESKAMIRATFGEVEGILSQSRGSRPE